MKTTISQTARHPYGSVAFQLIPEAGYVELIYLARLREFNGRPDPDHLTTALRKATWVVSAGVELLAVSKFYDDVCSPAVANGHVVEDFVGRVRYERSLVDFASHLKGFLDSLARFCRKEWKLFTISKPSQIDFKQSRFRRKLVAAAPQLKQVLEELHDWIRAGNHTFENAIYLRDELIHRDPPCIVSQLPAQEVGSLPIPRAPGEFPARATPKNCFSSREFVEFHIGKMWALLRAVVVARVVAEEQAAAGSGAPKKSDIDSVPLAEFPAKPTTGMRIEGMTTRAAHNWDHWVYRPAVDGPDLRQMKKPV